MLKKHNDLDDEIFSFVDFLKEMTIIIGAYIAAFGIMGSIVTLVLYCTNHPH